MHAMIEYILFQARNIIHIYFVAPPLMLLLSKIIALRLVGSTTGTSITVV